MSQWVTQDIGQGVSRSMCQWMSESVRESPNVSVHQRVIQWISQSLNPLSRGGGEEGGKNEKKTQKNTAALQPIRMNALLNTDEHFASGLVSSRMDRLYMQHNNPLSDVTHRSIRIKSIHAHFTCFSHKRRNQLKPTRTKTYNLYPVKTCGKFFFFLNKSVKYKDNNCVNLLRMITFTTGISPHAIWSCKCCVVFLWPTSFISDRMLTAD